jgi:hypothetical protein
MLAPEMGPANSASSAITAPTTTPPSGRTDGSATVTASTTNTSTAVSHTSSTNECHGGPYGIVDPSVGWPGYIANSSPLAANAPSSCAAANGSTCRPGTRPASHSPTVTAGFRCAPDTLPTA